MGELLTKSEAHVALLVEKAGYLIHQCGNPASIDTTTFATLGSNAYNAVQFMAQLVGVAILIGFILPITYGLNCLLGHVIPHRVSPDGERQGMDLHELGADAYPEFVVHADELMG